MATHSRRAYRATAFDERHPFSPATSAASRETLTESEIDFTGSLTESINHAIETGDWTGVAASAEYTTPSRARAISDPTVGSEHLQPMRNLAGAAFARHFRDSSQLPTPASSRSDSSEFQFPTRDYYQPSGATNNAREPSVSSKQSSKPASVNTNSTTGSRPKRVVNITTASLSSSRPVSRDAQSTSSRDVASRSFSRDAHSSTVHDASSRPVSRDVHPSTAREIISRRPACHDAPSSTARDASSRPASRDSTNYSHNVTARPSSRDIINSSLRDATYRPPSRETTSSSSSRNTTSRPNSRDAPSSTSQDAASRPISRDHSDPTSRSTSGSLSTPPSSLGFGVIGAENTAHNNHIQNLMLGGLQLNDHKPKDIRSIRNTPLYQDRKLPKEERQIMDLLEQLRNEVHMLKDHNNMLREQNSLLEQGNMRLQATNDTKDNQVADLKKQNLALGERNSLLQKENMELQAHADRANDHVAELNAENKKLVTDCNNANDRADTLADQVKRLQVALGETTTQLQSMYESQQQDAGLRVEVEQLRKQVTMEKEVRIFTEKSQKQDAGLKVEVEQLRKQLAEEKEARVATEKDHEFIIQDYERVQKDHREVFTLFRGFKEDHAHLEKENEKLRRENKDLQEEVLKLKNQSRQEEKKRARKTQVTYTRWYDDKTGTTGTIA
ncbi:hypothetical protein MCOR27_010697 [Pyricularia oryzae]|uniref:Uncharacterized protein n=2 Tax=Pyricularia TaxID=48558 RepID=A0ABQ8NI34_PYRGI|nr:hypothetical protein MCOR01_005138 [Pyricularia oryzae]KAI6297409.1 hypothetical protein MCOR33_006243 [Pyricularia grisea]KAH9431904.1 hypothetical protein MCOR02_009170 [Pyricularia oryzae]KAI6255773.1 hypothetical protein MCOR19_007735 [Pyricularia oryzae]KAI6265482.1 hypothetical protein MCOR26_010713 [Pyricularia oryzae]